MQRQDDCETSTLKRLSDISTRLWRARDVEDGLREMLAATIEMLAADMGNVQILQPERNVLTIAVQQGFDQEFLNFFSEVSVEDDSACGRALHSRERVVVTDVETEPTFAPYREIARAAGFRAVQSTPLLAHNGNPLGIVSTHFRWPRRLSEQEHYCLDLYARLAANFIERFHYEERLRQRADDLSAILDALPICVWLGDAECQDVRGNAAANKMTNVAAGTNVSQSAAKAGKAQYLLQLKLDGTEYRIDELPMQKATSTGSKVVDAYIDFRFPDGRRVETMGNAVPLFDPDGRVRGSVAAFYDVTRLKETERSLRAAEASLQATARLKDEFIATLAHELRNPLAAVGSAFHVLLKQAALADIAPRPAEIIERQLANLVRLVDDLLDISRLTTGKIDLQIQALDIGVLLRQALEACNELIERRRHRTDLSIGVEPLLVDGDDMRLSQVFTNIITNAAKYTPPEGLIKIVAHHDADHVTVRIKDNGVGVPPEMLKTIFGFFVQIKPTSGDLVGDGLGIGLTLSRSIVGLHGGVIEAFSDGEGLGCEFVVALPAAGKGIIAAQRPQ